jgi:uncharacterized protein
MLESVDLVERLRASLRAALETRDMIAASALRSALAAIANAEAVPEVAGVRFPGDSPHVAGGTAGLRSGEADRRVLSEAEIARIIRREAQDRQIAAAEYERTGRIDRARRLRREAKVLAAASDSAIG